MKSDCWVWIGLGLGLFTSVVVCLPRQFYSRELGMDGDSWVFRVGLGGAIVRLLGLGIGGWSEDGGSHMIEGWLG